jgi:hypothetical protein
MYILSLKTVGGGVADDRAYMDIFTACLKRQYIHYFRPGSKPAVL